MNKVKFFCSIALFTFCLNLHGAVIELDVKGLVCELCVKGVESSLRKLSATDDVYVDLQKQFVAVKPRNGADIDDTQLRQAITDAGFALIAVRRTSNDIEDFRSHQVTQSAHEK